MTLPRSIRSTGCSLALAIAVAFGWGSLARGAQPGKLAFGVAAAPAAAPGEADGEPADQKRDNEKPRNEKPGEAAPKRLSSPATSAIWVLRTHDKNGDGLLDQEEWKGVKGDPAAADRNGDGLLTYYELLVRLTEKANDGRRSQRLSTPRERLPEGLPSWFTDRDRNGDGQVAMHEYERRWDDGAARRFARLDPNGDGLITAEEARAER
ncbi:hypothetical protein [Botrimarina sp.]|uniref:EF-hand domain-containing protein n=1 Tax=Botrimarina sp. TaxID=2795802 RepID=UPI0032EE8511